MDPLQASDVPVAEELLTVPPKFPQEPEVQGVNWLRTAGSLALYLILGLMLFGSWELLLLLTLIVILHELGHFAAMKAFRYKDLGIFFIPLLGAYVSGSKREVSQRESAIILLAGPMPGIIIGVVIYLITFYHQPFFIGDLSSIKISGCFIFLNLINLFPVYPLDGGQLLNRVFLDEDSWISRGFVLLSIAFLVWFALYGFSQPIYPLLIFPAMMLYRMFGDKRLQQLEKKVEESGIDMNKSYEELPDEDYWKVRNIIIAEHPAFRNVSPAPPYAYHPREDKIQSVVESLLHRHLVQDMPVWGKLIVLVIWLAGLGAPWIIGMGFSFLRAFGIG